MENPTVCNWLNCNRCSITYKPDLRFFLAECGHIFCDKCVRNMDDNIQSSNATKQCSVCNRSIACVEINRNMDQSIYDFFQPIEKQLKKTLDIYLFQMQHKDKLLNIITRKYDHAKKIWSQNIATIQKLQKENQAMRSLIKHQGAVYGNNSIGSAISVQSGNDSFNNVSLQSIQSSLNSGHGYPQKFNPGLLKNNTILTPIHQPANNRHMTRSRVTRLTPLQERFAKMPSISASTSLDSLKKPPHGKRN